LFSSDKRAKIKPAAARKARIDGEESFLRKKVRTLTSGIDRENADSTMASGKRQAASGRRAPDGRRVENPRTSRENSQPAEKTSHGKTIFLPDNLNGEAVERLREFSRRKLARIYELTRGRPLPRPRRKRGAKGGDSP
jgi:hypothetical protein